VPSDRIGLVAPQIVGLRPSGVPSRSGEQDNAPSATDPGQSLRFAEISYEALSRLRSSRR
jgi:hypothetical protein